MISIGRTSRRWRCWTSSPAHGWSPLLIVGAYRHEELEARDTGRGGGPPSRTEHLHLEGLNEPEVMALVAGVAGEERSERWAADIHRRTGGHPFFVREMAHLLDTASDAAGMPSVVGTRSSSA